MPTQNDIPVAQRISEPKIAFTKASNPILRSLRSVPWWAYALAIVAFLTPIVSTQLWVRNNLPLSSQPNQPNQDAIAPSTVTPPQSLPTVAPFISTNASSSSQSSANTQGNNAATRATNSSSVGSDRNPQEQTIFGHHAFAEAPANQLRTVSRASDGYEIKLRESAAKSYLQMVEDARRDGVEFVLISGFRSISEQQQLFFEISKQRNQTPAERAKVSAPPGHSEHHTGYAVDLGDAAVPSANLSQSFEKTEAFQWLRNNANRYGFEMSFPPNNPQGVMYEPWHWRFVGDNDSLATFYKK
ncbi:MAG: M15 family metallopeptidase [Pseudanabaenaceae cyanobacterium bins.39]|nr:M15 family metallopeptidase [Pseudanabaenaceae cyanobacterium bins.39]